MTTDTTTAVFLDDLFDTRLLEQRIREGYVRSNTSDDGMVTVLNYAEKATYEGVWDEVTINCRGLVFDPANSRVLARGFPKFFNLEQHEPDNRHGLGPLPLHETPVEVTEKLDGSLGILVPVPRRPGSYETGRWRIVTRGSADSDQAKFATTKLMPDLFLNPAEFAWDRWEPQPGITYLFEIIYPENRIVVNYGDVRDLVWLAALDNRTGLDVDVSLPPWWSHRRIIGSLNGTGSLIEELRSGVRDDEEGFVVRWADGTRAKVKGAEYVRLHGIVTRVSTKTVWEHLSRNEPLDELLERVPDEFEKWLRQQIADLTDAKTDRTSAAWTAFREVLHRAGLVGPKDAQGDREARKRFADVATLPEYRDVRAPLFLLLDGKDIDKWAWQVIKPEYARPFTVDADA